MKKKKKRNIFIANLQNWAKFFEQVFLKSLAIASWKYHNLLHIDLFAALSVVPAKTPQKLVCSEIQKR